MIYRQDMLQLLLEAKAQADGVQRDLIQARYGPGMAVLSFCFWRICLIQGV